jgi:cytochrome c biogenesis protein CcdA
VATFLEGVGSIGIVCTLAALVPAVALVLVARKARLTVAVSYLVGVALLTWARASGHWSVELSGVAMFIASAALVVGAFVLAYRAKRPVSLAATGSGVVAGALAGWLWTPCVGPKLGEILNNTDTEAARTLGLMLVYMAGALLPAVLLAVLPHALPAIKRALDRLPAVAVGGAVGAAYAVTLATGRYDLVVGELYRISTT